YKNILRPLFNKAYKHELINNLFFHPYTKIEYMRNDMMVQRKAATKYLDKIVETGLLDKVKKGRENYYINVKLCNLFLSYSELSEHKEDTIDSIIN
ncbi:MAG: Fic family protein, partial [Prevotella sp.]|nr:Fic family protein [Prevotella sp.]MBR6015870.1 Fic family protein [Prevotella sp.]